LETTVRNQNSIEEVIKSRLNAGNACCHAVQKILSSLVVYKNVKIKTYKTIILSVVLYGCETWSLTLREEQRLRVFDNRAQCGRILCEFDWKFEIVRHTNY
jgi:hypothetical protein